MGGSPKNEFIQKCLDLYSQRSNKKLNAIIETGTYYGKGAIILSYYFQKVHTIELNQDWYNKTKKTLSPYKNIYCHFGDSAFVLENLVNTFNFPLAYYLDAHYSGGTTSFGLEEVPLLRELDVLKKRTYTDLIIIDDFRLMGLKGTCGHPNHPYYPVINFDWSNITIESILQTLNLNNDFHLEVDNDRVILITNLSDIST